MKNEKDFYKQIKLESSQDKLNRDLREVVEATGDPFLGILTKLYTKEGMSSQLVLRYDAKKRGEIKELLEGEKEYEEARHSLHVFYQTKNFCDLPNNLRQESLIAMQDLQKISDEGERQKIAERHPILGLNSESDN